MQRTYLLGVAILASLVAHVAAASLLPGEIVTVPMARPHRAIRVVPLPAPESPEEPVPKVQPEPAIEKDRPLPRKASKTERVPAAAAAAPSPTPEQPPPSGPVRLAGFALSNRSGGFVQGSGRGDGPAVTTRRPAAPREPATRPAPPKMTPLGQLGRKPQPPSMAGALRRAYPQRLRNQGVEGQAQVRLTLSKTGKVERLVLLSESHAGFGRACSSALRSSVWSPPLNRSGQTVRTALVYRCRFKLNS